MNINILIVDDKEENLYILEDMLKNLKECSGIKIFRALNSNEALKISVNNNIDLIITEIQMPDMDGLEMAKFLKLDSKTKDIPIIFLTAVFKAEKFIGDGFEVGTVDYLIKPIEKYQLLNRVNSYIDLFLTNKEFSKTKKELENINNNLEQKISNKIANIKKQNQKTNMIFNMQNSIIVIGDGKQVSQINDIFFKTFNYKDLTDFNKQHNCICELFIYKPNTPHLMPIMEGGISWIEYVTIHPDQLHLAYMIDKKNNERIYNVTVSGGVFKENNENIIILTEITELFNLKNDLEQRVEREIEHNCQKDLQLFASAKMASMGEMIGNIAHQWRQPLATISSVTLGIKIKLMMGKLDFSKKDERESFLTFLNTKLDIIETNIEYLSTTIDTFQDFIKEKKELKEVILQERIDLTLDILKESLKNNYIEIKNNLDYNNPVKINIVIGELSQVITNIINNAKDALVENNIDNPWIKISLIQKNTNLNKMAIIIIEDNGGGIPDKVLPKIFNPYFTTKHKSIGTGLGLYMSYKIVTQSLKGKLYVKNSKYGAKFFIELPYK